MSKNASIWERSTSLLRKAGYTVRFYKQIGNVVCGRLFVKGVVFTLRAGELSAIPVHNTPPMEAFYRPLREAIEELQSRGFNDWRISDFPNGSGGNDFYLDCVLLVEDKEAAILAVHLEKGHVNSGALSALDPVVARFLAKFAE